MSQPVIFGEVLFDTFPDGRRVLGGAPFNVAWGLKGFGLDPLFISRVGDDVMGERIVAAMEAWGMRTDGIQKDPIRPTGVVEVRFYRGQPRYDIVPDQAYDHIDAKRAIETIGDTKVALLYHGTLAARTPKAKERLATLIKECAPPRFIDVNLRAPWWNREETNDMVHGAATVKLNEIELSALNTDDLLEEEALREAALTYRSTINCHTLIVTRGEKGAFWVEGADIISIDPIPVDPVVDTVGAGDAFAASCIASGLRRENAKETLQRAMEFAAKICAIQGATSPDTTLYEGV